MSLQDSSPSPGPILEGLLELMGCSTPEGATAVALPLLGRTSGADAAGVLRYEAGTVAGEIWCAHGSREEVAWRAAAARELSGQGEARDDGCGCVRVVAAIETAAAGSVLCLGFADRAAATAFDASPGAARVARMVAGHLAALHRLAASRAERGEYQRRFRRLDDQLRLLDRERQKFVALVNQTRTLVFVSDAAGTIRWVNKAMAELSPPDQVSLWIGRNCTEVCGRLATHADGAGCAECPARAALEAGRPADVELQSRRDGAVHSYYLTALPIRGPDGRPEEAIVSIQDLSDLEAVRRSEARYRVLYERSANAIVMGEPGTWRVLLANPAACRMTGYTQEELQGFTLRDLHPAEEWPRLLEQLESPGTASAAGECLVAARGGETRVATFHTLRFDLDGREVVLVEMRDITDRKQAEDAWRRAELRLRTVVANLPVVLFAIDPDGLFTLSEGKGLEALGLKPGEVVGRSASEVYRDVPEVLDHVRRALAGEEVAGRVNVGNLWFETRYVPLTDASGRVAGLIGVAADVTEQRRLEEQLRHSQKLEALGRLAGGVAHDFNNLLTAILGQCELLLRRSSAADPGRASVEEIHKAGVRGALLTRQLLAFSRKDLVISQVLDLCAAVGEMDGMLRRLIGEDIELVTHLPEQPAWVRIDPGHIEQVLMNLAVNARDAMPRGGSLDIRVSDEDGPPSGAVVLTVSDTGVGMDEKVQAHLFEPFFTTKEAGKGTGLGLSIVYGIVLQCGGDIQVDSGTGRGTRVRVSFPRAEAEPRAQELLAAADARARGDETVLLVEDDPAVRPVVKEILELAGYAVLEAGNGSEALARSASHPGRIHLLLTDVVMPRMSGGELAQHLATRRPETRVLFMSGNNDDAMVRHGVARASAAFIQKPFTLDALLRKVREALDAHERRAAPGPGGAHREAA